MPLLADFSPALAAGPFLILSGLEKRWLSGAV